MILEPTIRTERQEIHDYLAEQIASLRASAKGLSEEQARLAPTASTLSIGGLLKHVAHVFGGLQNRLDHPDGRMDQAEYERLLPVYEGSFALTDHETLDGILATYDAAAERYLVGIAALDPDGEMNEPAAPWFGRMEPTPTKTRFYLLHQLEELARHAGHADIIREQIDGKSTFALMAAG